MPHASSPVACVFSSSLHLPLVLSISMMTKTTMLPVVVPLAPAALVLTLLFSCLLFTSSFLFSPIPTTTHQQQLLHSWRVLIVLFALHFSAAAAASHPSCHLSLSFFYWIIALDFLTKWLIENKRVRSRQSLLFCLLLLDPWRATQSHTNLCSFYSELFEIK